MDFFEAKTWIYLLLFFVVIPIGMAALIYFIKAKFIWLAPIAAVICGLLLTVIFYPYYFADINILGDSYDSTTVYWLYFFIPVQFIISILVTVVCRFINRFRGKM